MKPGVLLFKRIKNWRISNWINNDSLASKTVCCDETQISIAEFTKNYEALFDRWGEDLSLEFVFKSLLELLKHTEVLTSEIEKLKSDKAYEK